jgi:hypothetical protein
LAFVWAASALGPDRTRDELLPFLNGALVVAVVRLRGEIADILWKDLLTAFGTMAFSV